MEWDGGHRDRSTRVNTYMNVNHHSNARETATMRSQQFRKESDGIGCWGLIHKHIYSFPRLKS